MPLLQRSDFSKVRNIIVIFIIIIITIIIIIVVVVVVVILILRETKATLYPIILV